MLDYKHYRIPTVSNLSSLPTPKLSRIRKLLAYAQTKSNDLYISPKSSSNKA